MQVYAITFKKSDWVPNNPAFPVLLYRSVFLTEDGSEDFARLFTSHGWQGVWRNGVFDYQHYHTGAHEVLGVGKGQARLLIGGPTGETFSVKAGDCLLLPAGTGHMNLGASDNFEVVGAYPVGQHADIQTSAPSKGAMETIASLPAPETDPVNGPTGRPMMKAWCS
ncbi:cupin [Rhizobium cauense]|uniref:cupin n=1 Tax=Rhizobium cauense TaxID=1166683 RepID=UPI001C6F58F1|nr:cupin [Rhizobium cauense]MBW9115623.1 cupin [Rhizobium cauense]